MALTNNSHVIEWVNEMTGLCRPDRVVWCDGSADERKFFLEEAVTRGELLPLDQKSSRAVFITAPPKTMWPGLKI